MITEQQLAHWRKLADEATAGEWEAVTDDKGDVFLSFGESCMGFATSLYFGDMENVDGEDLRNNDFIAASRTAVPALLDEVESTRARVAEAEARAQTAEAQVGRLREVLEVNTAAFHHAANHAFAFEDCPFQLCEGTRRIVSAALAASAPETGEREAVAEALIAKAIDDEHYRVCDGGENPICYYCGCGLDYETVQHADSCLHLRAKALLEHEAK